MQDKLGRSVTSQAITCSHLMVKGAKEFAMPYFPMANLSLLLFLFLLFTLLVSDLSTIFKFLFYFLKKFLLLVFSLGLRRGGGLEEVTEGSKRL